MEGRFVCLFVFVLPVDPIYNCLRISARFLLLRYTNCHGDSGLNQHNYILLQFWAPQVRHWFHWAKPKVSAGLPCLLNTLGEFVACLFQLGEAAYIPWLMILPPLQSQQCSIFSPLWSLLPSLHRLFLRLWSSGLLTRRNLVVNWSHLHNPG